MITVLSSNLLVLSLLTEKKKAKRQYVIPKNVFHVVKNIVHAKALDKRHTEGADTSLKNSEWLQRGYVNTSNEVRKTKIRRTKNFYLSPTNIRSALETKVSAAAAELLSSGMQGSSRNHTGRVGAVRHPSASHTELPLRSGQRRAALALPGELAH